MASAGACGGQRREVVDEVTGHEQWRVVPDDGGRPPRGDRDAASCSGQTRYSSQASSSGSARSSGWGSNPARQTTVGGPSTAGPPGRPHRHGSTGPGPAPHDAGAVVVAVAVGVEAQPGRGADLEQRQGAVEEAEDGQQRGAPAGLVGLGAARQQLGAHPSPLGEEPRDEVVRLERSIQQRAHREQEVGLALPGGSRSSSSSTRSVAATRRASASYATDTPAAWPSAKARYSCAVVDTRPRCHSGIRHTVGMTQPAVTERYTLSQKITMMVNRYEVRAVDPSGGEGPVLAVAQQKRMAFKEQVTFYADEARTQPVFSFKARTRMDLGATYDVLDAAGTPIGWFRKDFGKSLLRSSWHLGTPDGLEAFGTERNQNIADPAPRLGRAARGRRHPAAVPLPLRLPGTGRQHRPHLGARVARCATATTSTSRRRATAGSSTGGSASAMAVALDALQSR